MPAAPLPPDETQRLESLQALRLLGPVFRSLVENSSDIIDSFDAEGRILYANPAWREALGYTETDLQNGLSVFQIVHPDFIAGSRDRLRRLFAGEPCQRFESRFITRDGRLLDVEGNVCCHVEEGRSRAACGIYRDITRRKAMDEESRRAGCEAEQASLAKSRFLANISHEIRAPLNGIIGMSSMLMLSGLNEDQLRYVRTIDSSGRVLLTLVNQILDFSKFDAAAGSLEQICFSLPKLIEEEVALMSVRAAEKGLRFRQFVDAKVPECLSGDPERLRQILTNLLGNAVKFTETGEIRLDVRVESEPARTPEEGIVLRFTVIDTGIGLQSDASARIFDAFAQADPSTTRKYGGTGLGLAISRQIVRLMGGDIQVHSTPGEGATFWFTARFGVDSTGAIASPAQPAQATAVPPPARQLRILIAEDNTINQLVLSEQLDKLGHASAVVRNGVEALEALKEPGWDAVLLDCQMPEMDGYETVAAIRRAEAAAGARRLWVVAVTANALEGEREACLRAGMDDFLAKPFQVQQLAGVIARIPLLQADGAAKPPVNASLLATLGESKAVNGENLFDRMVSLFTESGPQMLDQMDHALREDDFPTAIRAIHKLAGGCSYFGAGDLYTLCTDFERLGRQGDSAALRSLAPRIRQEYARAEFALRQYRPLAPPSA